MTIASPSITTLPTTLPIIAQLCHAYTGGISEESGKVVAFIQSQFHERVFRSVTVDPPKFPLDHPFLTRLPEEFSKDAFTIVLSYLPIREMIAISDISNDPAVWFSRALTLQTEGNFSLPILTQIYEQVPSNRWAALPRLKAAGLSATSIDVAIDVGALVTQTDAMAGVRIRRKGINFFADISTTVKKVKREVFDELFRIPRQLTTDFHCLVSPTTTLNIRVSYDNPYDRRKQAGDYHSASLLITHAQSQLDPLITALPPRPPAFVSLSPIVPQQS